MLRRYIVDQGARRRERTDERGPTRGGRVPRETVAVQRRKSGRPSLLRQHVKVPGELSQPFQPVHVVHGVVAIFGSPSSVWRRLCGLRIAGRRVRQHIVATPATRTDSLARPRNASGARKKRRTRRGWLRCTRDRRDVENDRFWRRNSRVYANFEGKELFLRGGARKKIVANLQTTRDWATRKRKRG